jgi:hypothetical protein
MEELLERLVPAIEQITRRKLFPTYSYFRVYKAGDVLQPHTDRPACEISVSINLGYSADTPWPIWIEGLRGAAKVEMEAGDAVVYRGIDCPHWREAFNGEYAAQLFLHYVDQHGPRAEWKFDKRRRLGTIPKQPIRLLKHVPPVRPDEAINLEAFKSARSGPLRSLIMEDLETERTVSEVIQHAMRQFRVSEFKAEALVLGFIALLEEEGVLTVESA